MFPHWQASNHIYPLPKIYNIRNGYGKTQNNKPTFVSVSRDRWTEQRAMRDDSDGDTLGDVPSRSLHDTRPYATIFTLHTFQD